MNETKQGKKKAARVAKLSKAKKRVVEGGQARKRAVCVCARTLQLAFAPCAEERAAESACALRPTADAAGEWYC